ncbi:ABC transporter ATP-binding protein [Terrisporobacter sp.]|uniref:ABC transporter ATP-binding protein n=1 Tax=Terrisporobacter sp. TaxID=1965305 RepID=UPI0026321ECD|nr:ATP-binding cassette domain-containing protein [Terrisporobacter sp.]
MLLKAEKINYKYRGDNYILKDIDLSVESNEIVGVVAPSGFGKTTLAKILAGYIKPDKGKVILEGYENKNTNYNPVQLIFQHPEKSVNPKWKMKKTLNEAYKPDDKMIEAMGIKKEWLNRWPSELSGGELQRFCVLRALSKETKFLIADEMTTMLDAITQAQIWNVVIDYCKENEIGLIVISHDKDLVYNICDRVINLEKRISYDNIKEERVNII